MNILVISHTYIASINRDKWKVLAQLYPQINLKVLVPTVWQDVLFKLEADDLDKDNLKNCEFLPLDTFKGGNEVLYGYYPIKFIKLLKSFKPYLIHVEQGDNAFSYFQSILFSKLFCKKTKFTFFTWINWKPKKSWKYKFFWQFVESFNLRNSNGAFVGNEDAKNILKEKYFKKPILVLPQLGVDTNFFVPKSKEQNKTIGFVGRLVREKGIFDLVDAFSQIIFDHPEWKLKFLGGGNHAEDFKKYIAQKNLENKITICNSVDHFQVKDFIQSVDFLVLPSFDTNLWREQFGHVIIEAMSCKVSVIGSDAGEIPNVIADAGLIFEQRDIKGLAGCLKILIEDKNLREKLAEKGYERVKKFYSHEAIAKRTYEFWCEVLKS
ncbi:TPA: glycosyltransferase family 4 protein [Candidatus Dependentiae bacterium]|nr:MAG: Glycosyl transferase group 1 [candidate division TM6 bacterium GW2011_GWE2_31_21]KKP53927.1 MAG: Glycosyl transferase group 1 [candidate division TM6 bacterium GW2011_GWF2_33_332]HBS47707.1 glycosyltransferase family 4 protein [Candidatus Dependentiae bacterium]HBZ73856.1 glycosyltransferase family 4 protein [Candidatus Dependentiae bacterium]